MSSDFNLNGQRHTIDDVLACCRSDSSLQVGSPVIELLERARVIVGQYLAGDEAVYGLNTGLGANLGYRIEPESIADFQEQLILGRCVGAGEPLAESTSRLALLCRIVGMSRGASGISVPAFNQLCRLFDRGLSPVIPKWGSIGAGDLTLGANIGAALIGHGRIWYQGRILSATDALKHTRVDAIKLQAKDALALCNHSAVSTAFAIETLGHVEQLLRISAAVALLAAEAYGFNPSILDTAVQELRPSAGQIASAQWFRRALSGSSAQQPGASRSIQDALSFRVMAPLFGTVNHAFAAARDEVEIELNGACDNPAVLVDEGRILSTPNFDTGSIALAMDQLAVALSQASFASLQRIIKLMSPALSGLPRYLTPVGGASAGMVPMQKTAVSLHASVRHEANPASLDAQPVSETVEDVAPQTLLSISKLERQLEPLRTLVSIEALVASQATDLRDNLILGRAASIVYQNVRERVAQLVEDRALGLDIDTVRDNLFESDLFEQLQAI